MTQDATEAALLPLVAVHVNPPRGALLTFPEADHELVIAARRAAGHCEECGANRQGLIKDPCPFGYWPDRCLAFQERQEALTVMVLK